MPNNNRRSGGTSAAKIYTTVVTLLLIALIVVCGVFFGTGKWQVTPDAPEQEQGAVVGDVEENGISLMSTRISPANYADYGIDPQADTAFEITATVTPENATDKSITLSLAFKNSGSEWATGKTVTDYVELSTTTVQSGVPFTLTCNEAYGESILMTATANGGENVNATLTLEYVHRYTAIDFGTLGIGNLTLKTFGASDFGADNSFNAISIDTTAGVGTMYEDISNIKITLTSSVSGYQGSGYNFAVPASATVDGEGDYSFTATAALNWAELYSGVWNFDYDGDTEASSLRAFREALEDDHTVTLTVTFEGATTGAQYNFDTTLIVSGYDALYVYVTDIEFDGEGISDGKLVM